MVLISYLLMGCHLDGLDQACIHHHRQYQTSLSHQNFRHLKEIKPKTTVDKRYITFGLCMFGARCQIQTMELYCTEKLDISGVNTHNTYY